MSLISNSNPTDMFVLEAIGRKNAYQHLQKYHHSADLDSQYSLAQGEPPPPRFQAYGVQRNYSENRVLGIEGQNTSLLTSNSVAAKVPEIQNSPSALFSESYIRKDFLDFLDEVNRTEGFDNGLVAHHVKQLFALLQYHLDLDKVPNPQVMPGEDKALSLTWQNEIYQVEVSVSPNGLVDWFWANMTNDDYEGYEGKAISSKLVRLFGRLKDIFSGI